MVAIAGLCLLAITPAGAAGPKATIGQLQAANASLASKSRAAVLQLYSLDAELTSSQSRLTALHLQMQKLEQQRGWLLRERRAASLDTRLSQQRLASRLRFIYDHGSTTSLDILMGSQSIGDAITEMDDVNKVAASNADVLGQVQSSRKHLSALARTLGARRQALEAATAEASSTVARLEQLRRSRAGYIDDLARQRSLDTQRLTALTAQAQAASARAQTITASANSRTQQAASVAPVPVSAAVPVSVSSAPVTGPAEGSGATQVSATTQGSGTTQVSGLRTLTVVATGYDLAGRTSTGLPVGWGVAAVDPSVIPLGTRITIPGYGVAVAADTGGSIVGSTIDLWFPTAAQANAWGRRTITISVD